MSYTQATSSKPLQPRPTHLVPPRSPVPIPPQALDRFSESVRLEVQHMLNPGNVERALHELQVQTETAPPAVSVPLLVSHILSKRKAPCLLVYRGTCPGLCALNEVN